MARRLPLRGRCPHCGAAGTLFLEEVHGDVDAVCMVCGFRRTGVVRPRARADAGRNGGSSQQQLPIPTS